AQVLEDVPHARLAVAVDLPRPGGAIDDRLVGKPRDDEPDDCADQRDRNEAGHQFDGVLNALTDVRIFERRDQHREAETDEEQKNRKAGQQDQRFQPVVPDMRFKAVGLEHAAALPVRLGSDQNLTCGAVLTAARSASSTSKNVRSVKPNEPAMSTAGNDWMEALYSATELLKKRRAAAILFSMSES